MSQAVFVLDLDRCTGCAACVVACTNENPASAGLPWRSIYTFNRPRFPLAPVYHFSLACNHCLEPACLVNCPANAYERDPGTGAVLIQAEKCIGCRYCTWVCPYDAPRFDVAGGVVEKCTFCVHRLREGSAPACVTACPLDALRVERVDEPAATARLGFPDTGLRPAIRVTGQRRNAPPLMTAAPAPVSTTALPRPSAWSAFRAEWSLWFFTSLATLLVAWFTAATALGRTVLLPVFALAGLAGMAVSALHLGRIRRAWRAARNVRRSWISREVVFFTVFFAVVCGVGIAGEPSGPWPWSVAAIGWAALFSMDMVYRVPGQEVPAVPHSAMATLGAAYYIGLLLASPALALPAAAAKLSLYLMRRQEQPALFAVRVGVGLALPCVLLVSGAASVGVLLGTAVLGELTDRAQFYARLRFLSPSLQIERDLAQNLA